MTKSRLELACAPRCCIWCEEAEVCKRFYFCQEAASAPHVASGPARRGAYGKIDVCPSDHRISTAYRPCGTCEHQHCEKSACGAQWQQQ